MDAVFSFGTYGMHVHHNPPIASVVDELTLSMRQCTRFPMRTYTATILFCLGFAGTGHAAKPISVWVYGDGETSRMLSEIGPMLPTGTNAVTVIRSENLPMGTVMEGSGPDALGSTPSLRDRVFADLFLHGNWPDVVHIGYNASAFSWLNCNCASLNPPCHSWQDNYVAIAQQEAADIKAAADLVSSLGITVLLSKGPGAYQGTPPAVPDQCMQAAFGVVSWLLAYTAGQYAWVDYSGFTATLYTPSSNWQMVSSSAFLWEADGLHISENCSHYRFPPGQQYSKCTTNTGTNLGSWRVAKNVAQAYKFFQN